MSYRAGTPVVANCRRESHKAIRARIFKKVGNGFITYDRFVGNKTADHVSILNP